MESYEEICRELNTHDWKPKKERMGILIIDMQEYFRQICRPILQNIRNIMAAARENNIPLFFSQHGHEPEGDTGMLGQWWSDLIFKGSPEARLLPELEINADDIVIPKERYSAFYKTDLEDKLKAFCIQDLVIGGVMTNLCCETTARDAFVRGLNVFFLADGTSSVHRDFHLASLKNLAYGFATIMTCDRLIQAVG